MAAQYRTGPVAALTGQIEAIFRSWGMAEPAVTASAEGYAPAQLDITVGGEASQDFRLRLARLPGLLQVTTQPVVAAEVSLDGKPVGRTPLADLGVPAGIHRIAVVAPRYQPWETTLTVEGGGLRQTITAPLKPGWAVVTVSTVPAGAVVLVDGVSAGTTPASLELMPGTRTLVLEKDGFKALTRLVSVVASEPICVRLIPSIWVVLSPAICVTLNAKKFVVDNDVRCVVLSPSI